MLRPVLETIIIILAVLVGVLFIINGVISYHQGYAETPKITIIAPNQSLTEEVVSEIVRQSENANIDPVTSLRIAACESRFDPYASNAHSSAKGVYQFIDGTWDSLCEGEVFKYQDNIACFMKLYKKYPSYWECR